MLDSSNEVRRGGDGAHLMIANPTLAVEVAADEGGAFLAREREHELRNHSFTASHESGPEHATQEAAERQ